MNGMRSTICSGLALALTLTAGCSSSSNTPANIKNVVGTYTVTVSNGTATDDDVMSVRAGSLGTLLFTFTAGITTPDSGADSTGLHATIDNAYALTFASQAVMLDQAQGTADGTMTGTGKVSGSGFKNILLTLSFVPGTTVPLSSDAGLNVDGGTTPPVVGTAATLTVTGTKN